ncbi:methionine--tRNA ligase [Ferrovibrio sp.]|uniref:methionine--tRNA ligase n=1 Tax=Ferrovibrio sp. TaxID=1917215 RepID=UPI003511E72F
MTQKNYYITTPIYYVNDKPHIGHAYTTLACDVLARFKRLDGNNVMFLTGTDEHGQKVEKSAEAAGVDPQAFCDRVSQTFRDLAVAMNISNDDFIRTTEPRHVTSVQALWKKLEASGNIYLGHYEGWYAVRDEAFYQEDELQDGPGGQKLAPSGAPVEWVKEPSYFFRLSAWEQPLLDFYEKNPGFILPASRRNEVVSFVKGGLKDLSVSRTTFKWGIPVPGDEAHVMYVWLDALTNYITAAGYPETGSEAYRTFWPADLHMVGKDILRFHAVYWPAFLMAAGLDVPKRVFAHGWWTNEGQKISKSLGNVIDPLALVDEYGLDQTRYFLMREVPFGNDGDFRKAAIIGRINSELANGFGNLAQRTLSFCAKNTGAAVPAPSDLSEADEALLAHADSLLQRMSEALDIQAIHTALQHWFDLVDAANKYIDVEAPWTLRKTDPARMQTVLWCLLEAIRQLAILAQPFMPASAAKLLEQLGVSEAARSFAHLGEAGRLRAGTPLPQPQGVFPRHVEVAAQER